MLVYMCTFIYNIFYLKIYARNIVILVKRPLKKET